MIIVNLGFPKTSTTNLQTYLYPNLKNINYLGRNYKKINSNLFNELNDFIENRRHFSNSDLNNLTRNFEHYCKENKKILISQENWVVPYQKNNLTNKMEIVSQKNKLTNLLFILNKINIPYKFFFIQRDLKTSIASLFVTLQERIQILFGKKFSSFDFFLDHIDKKKDGWENLLLLLDTFNLNKIIKIIPKDKIQIFYYKDLLNDNEKFLNNLLNYLGTEKNYDFDNMLSIQTRKTTKNQRGDYEFQVENKILKFLKFLIPKFVRNKINIILRIRFIKTFLFKRMTVKKDSDILEKIIIKYF
ncbi:hypothetical protein N9U33_00410 [Candidatus Pelagibacter bacterium]|nr:hypothetical protein [Candidatus Pelagibacter bacterium]